MKKFLLGISFAALLCGAQTVQAGEIVKAKAVKTTAAASRAAAVPTTMVKYLHGQYDYNESTGVADCYMLFSDNSSATYDKYNGAQIKSGFVLYVDVFTGEIEETPKNLTAGTYTPSENNEAGTYDPYYTYLQYYDANGNEAESYSSVGNVLVENDAEGLKITVNIDKGTEIVPVTFTGVVELDDVKGPSSVYEQIKQNLDLEFTGSWNVYDGNLYDSNTGAMYYNLYENGYNDNGGMTEDGFSVALQMFGKMFKDSKEAAPDPGTYTMARNYNRYTFFPGVEVDYMGTTIVIGCYVKQRKTVNGMVSYAYSYISDGTITIEEEGDGVYTFTLDCETTLGHTVKGKFTGKMPIVDLSDDDGKGSSLSTLEDDVALDLEQHKSCYVWNGGVVNGCQTFLVDVGSPNGRGGNTEGDIMRLELVLPAGTQYIQEGNYTVMAEKYETYYQPFTLGRGRWVSASGGGTDLSGTRYMHFEEGRYLVMDHYAPAASGNVGITKISGVTKAEGDNDQYKIDIALMCDAQFHMDGSWSGPAELMYNPDGITAAIDGIQNDAEEVSIKWLDNNTVLVIGAASAENAAVYNTAGVRMNCEIQGLTINMSGMEPGIYVLNINGKSIKLAKK